MRPHTKVRTTYGSNSHVDNLQGIGKSFAVKNCQRLMNSQFYDLHGVEECRVTDGAQRDLNGDEGDMVVLPRFRSTDE